MGLDFEGAGPPVAHIDNAGILPWPLHHPRTARGQPFEVHPGGFIGAVLAPHDAVDSQLGQPRRAAQGGHDTLRTLWV